MFRFRTVVLICINFYITGIRKAVLTFRDASATYYHDRYKAIAEAIVNLLTSIVLAKYMGIDGVILGTILSAVFISLWIEPMVLYKYVLKTRVSSYFKKMLLYAGVTFFIAIVSIQVCGYIVVTNMFVQTVARVICENGFSRKLEKDNQI